MAGLLSQIEALFSKLSLASEKHVVALGAGVMCHGTDETSGNPLWPAPVTAEYGETYVNVLVPCVSMFVSYETILFWIGAIRRECTQMDRSRERRGSVAQCFFSVLQTGKLSPGGIATPSRVRSK